MSRATEQATEHAHNKQRLDPMGDGMTSDEIIESLAGSYNSGAKALLEWARSRQICGVSKDGKYTPFGTVNLSDLEAYFAEGEK